MNKDNVFTHTLYKYDPNLRFAPYYCRFKIVTLSHQHSDGMCLG